MVPVESFLPTSAEPKLTIEKTVRRKPSMQELTTIESPGNPIPASEMNIDASPKKTRAKKPKVEKIEVRKGNATLIITEKPQAALKIANALGDAQKYMENNVPFYELQRDGKTII